MTDSVIDPHLDLEHHDDHEHDHPQERQYWVVFVVLGVVTAVEVAWSYMGLSGVALVVPLVLMMLFKFVVVAGVFMHLYFDLKFLNGKYFTMMFGSGVILAVTVFFVMFAAFRFQI